MDINKIYCGDCLEVMKEISDKSINLIIVDPPYNINKADWDKIPNYIEWLGKRLLEMQRVLKDNGSFYLFHNDFLQMVEIQHWINKNSKFVFKQLITWEKYQTNKQYYGRNVLMGLNNTHKRNYYSMAEYILFYTFQDEVYNNPNCFKELKEYFYNEKEKGNFTNKDINKILGTATNGSGMAGHYFKKDLIQWTLPTKEMYKKLQKTGYFKREYKDLCLEYEDLRYTFNFVKRDVTTTWLCPPAKKEGHITPKPIELIKNILKHSSNEGDIILIPFVGSGNDCIACKQLKRNYIGIENKEKYVEIARRRIKAIPELLF